MSKDPYNAGKCEQCGEYAVTTQRHPGAPVFCKNGHSWKRDSISLAKDKKIQELIDLLKKCEIEFEQLAELDCPKSVVPDENLMIKIAEAIWQ